MRRYLLILLLAALVSNGYAQLAYNKLPDIEKFPGGPIDSLRINTYNNCNESISPITRLHVNRKPAVISLGQTKNHQSVNGWYFPGTSEYRAVIIGGVHGSELSSIEVAQQLISLLQSGEQPFYSVVIIPSLFPDNAQKARSAGVGKISNLGRYTNDDQADPNRQLPALGKSFDASYPMDSHGREIETENQLLLNLIQEYKPSRIINLHAILDESKAGFFADPRTDCDGLALGFDSDSSLAVAMATSVSTMGGLVPGNHLNTNPTVLYHNDPPVANTGCKQQRNLKGSLISNGRGCGTSLGSWATTAVCDGSAIRPAIRLVTVEFPGYRCSSQYPDNEREGVKKNIRLYSLAIRAVFLAEVEPE